MAVEYGPVSGSINDLYFVLRIKKKQNNFSKKAGGVINTLESVCLSLCELKNKGSNVCLRTAAQMKGYYQPH